MFCLPDFGFISLGSLTVLDYAAMENSAIVDVLITVVSCLIVGTLLCRCLISDNVTLRYSNRLQRQWPPSLLKLPPSLATSRVPLVSAALPRQSVSISSAVLLFNITATGDGSCSSSRHRRLRVCGQSEKYLHVWVKASPWRTGGDHQDALISSKTWNPTTSPWMKQSASTLETETFGATYSYWCMSEKKKKNISDSLLWIGITRTCYGVPSNMQSLSSVTL